MSTKLQKIWKNKLTQAEINNITSQLSQLLEQQDSLNETNREFSPFWKNNLKQEYYDKLWLPKKPKSGRYVQAFYSQKEKLENGNSWVSMTKKTKSHVNNSLEFSLPESLISQLNNQEYELEPIIDKQALRGKAAKGLIKCLRIRLYPTVEEAKWLDDIHSQSRWMYNAALTICLQDFKNKKIDIDDLESINEKKLRDLVKRHRYEEKIEVNDKDKVVFNKQFTHDPTYKGWPVYPGIDVMNERIPRSGVLSFARALNSALSNKRAGNIEKFEMKYKSKVRCKTYTTMFEDKQFPAALKSIKSKYCYTAKVLKCGPNWRMDPKNKDNKRTFISFNDILIQENNPGGLTLEYDLLTNKHYILYTVAHDFFPKAHTEEGKKQSEKHAKKMSKKEKCKNPTTKEEKSKGSKVQEHIPEQEKHVILEDRRHNNQIATVDEENIRLISCDPGVRTFISGYDPQGHIITIGEDANIEIYNMLLYLDQLQSDKAYYEIKLVNRKLKNMVKELHWKSCRYLVDNYDIIVLPHFKTSEMLRSKKISRQTKRQMQAFSFYEFKQKLIYQCKKHNKRLIFVEEDYTSKTCGKCGNIKWDLEGNKVYTCNECGYIGDRDENGARNILLKNLRGVLA